MKKLIKSLGVVMVVALMCCAFAACGGGTGGGTKYTYDKTTLEGDSSMTSAMSTVTTMYDNLYKDSYIVVGSSEIKWTIGDDSNALSYKKDDDKYIISGDFLDKLSESMSGMGVGEIEITYWGAETSEGFKIVMEETVMGETISIVLNFTK